MEFKKWPSKSWRTQEWCNYFSFFSLWFFFGGSWLNSKERISLPYCYTSVSCESVSVSLHRIRNGQRGRSLHADFSPPLAFWKPVYPAKNYSRALCGFTTWNKISPAVCVNVRARASVCALQFSKWSGRRHKHRKQLLQQLAWFGGQVVRDSPDAESPLAGEIQIIFLFCYKWYFPTYVRTHSPVHYFFGWWMDRRMQGRRTAVGQRWS